jgi:hypothetical protein
MLCLSAVTFALDFCKDIKCKMITIIKDNKGCKDFSNLLIHNFIGVDLGKDGYERPNLTSCWP